MSDDELVQRVAETADLTLAAARRLVDDVVAFYRVPVADLVRERHRHLKRQGLRNQEIFALVRTELQERVVLAPAMTERQLRRIIYS